MSEPYANVRELLGYFIGRTLVDITQHDEEEFQEDGACYVMLHFDNGETLSFDITDEGGFHYTKGGPDDGDPV